MKGRDLAIAIAGVIGVSSAKAAMLDLYIGGSSTQLSFWKGNFITTVCGTNPVTTYAITGATISNEAWRCTAAVTNITGMAVGDIVTIHYNSELGSLSAIGPLVYDNAIAPRLFVNPDSLDCTGSLCAVTSYNNQTETFTSVNGTALQPKPTSGAFHQFDVGVLDMEIKHWALEQNWTDSSYNTAMGVTPSAAALSAITGGIVVNGQVYSVIVNNGGPAAAIGNLSKRSLSAIFHGRYDVWGDVPEVGGGNTMPIKLCRYERGLGAQVATSVFLTGLECGFSAAQLASVEWPNASNNTSNGAVRACVQGDAGAIGVTSLTTSSGWTTLNIDGVQANAHNAAAGFYPFAYETHVYNKSSVSGANAAMQVLAGQLISNAQRANRMSSQIELTATSLPNGQWTATTRRVAFALPIGGSGNTPPTVAKVKGDINPVDGFPDQASIGLVYNVGNNCKIPFNSNQQ